MGVDGSGWEWMGVDGRGWGKEWEWMEEDGGRNWSGWEQMGVDGRRMRFVHRAEAAWKCRQGRII